MSGKEKEGWALWIPPLSHKEEFGASCSEQWTFDQLRTTEVTSHQNHMSMSPMMRMAVSIILLPSLMSMHLS